VRGGRRVARREAVKGDMGREARARACVRGSREVVFLGLATFAPRVDRGRTASRRLSAPARRGSASALRPCRAVPPPMSRALTYATYLELERLLELQRPLSEGPEHDELLFIVVHQVYEL